MPTTAAEDLRIVALGSSSTFGTGASNPEMSYPAQLQRVLRRRYPDARIEVVNRGVPGQLAPETLARLDREVLALSPDLVIWQVGTNDAIYVGNIEAVIVIVKEGISRIKASGAKVMLLSPQPLRDELRDKPIREINEALRRAAAETGVVFLDRHQLMNWWLESGSLYPDEVIGEDDLHMTDRSYECLAIRIADVAPAVAAAPSPVGPDGEQNGGTGASLRP